jgi:hypothetical protein
VRRTALLSAIFCLVVSAPAARADWPPDGIVISTRGDGLAYDRMQLYHDPPSDLLAQYSPYWSELEVARIAASGAVMWRRLVYTNPSTMAPDGAGGMLTGWYASGSWPHHYDIFLQFLQPDGAYSPPGESNAWTLAGTNADETNPGVVKDGAGGAFVSWIDAKLRLRRVGPDATSSPGWPDAGIIIASTPPALAPIPARMMVDGTGGVFLLWITAENVRIQHVLANGSIASGWPAGGFALSSAPLLISSTTYGMTALDSEHFAVVWTETISASARRLVVQRLGMSGPPSPSWPAAGLLAFDTGTSFAFDWAPDGLGGVHLVCAENGAARLIHLMSDGTPASGYPAGGLSPLDAGAVLSGGVLLAAGKNGGTITAWKDNRTSQPGIRVRRLEADGTPDPAEPDTGRVLTSPVYTPGLGGLASDQDGTAYVLYSRPSGGAYASDLMLARLAPPQPVAVGDAPALEVGLTIGSPRPNPAKESVSLRLDLPAGVTASLELIDLTGRTVRSRTVVGSGRSIERFEHLEDLAPGIYFARISRGTGSRAVRFAVVR